MKTLKDIISTLDVQQVQGNQNVSIQDITADSRAVKPNSLFIALDGATVDGHNYIDKAVAAGAVAVIVSKPVTVSTDVCVITVNDTRQAMMVCVPYFFDYPANRMRMVGVTGTNGKTTTTHMIRHILKAQGFKVGVIGTVHIMIGDTSYPIHNTTPDVVDLQHILHQMVQENVEYCVMEVSSHALALGRVSGVEFDTAVFTNLTQDHLDFHKTLADYRDTKKKFFDSLDKTAFALTNVDDKNGGYMLQNTLARKCTYSLKTMADFRATVLENTFSGMLLRINEKEVWVSLIGKFNAYNLLAIYATAILLGEDSDQVLIALSQLTPVAGRFQYFVAADKRTLIVDYAHTPDALENVLETIRSIKQGGQQLITVVGCGGNRDKGKRPIMAHIATMLSDKVVLTSDNPRDEDPETILREMEAGIRAEYQAKYMTVTDRRQAIKVACHLAKAGDIILLAGKGHETYQEVKGERSHFDDMEEGKLIVKSEK